MLIVGVPANVPPVLANIKSNPVISASVPVPVVGTFIGFAVGTGVGIVVSWFIDDILGLIKDGLLDWMFD